MIDTATMTRREVDLYRQRIDDEKDRLLACGREARGGRLDRTTENGTVRAVTAWAIQRYSVGMIRQLLSLHGWKSPSGLDSWTDAEVQAILTKHGITTNAGSLAEDLGRLPNPKPRRMT